MLDQVGLPDPAVLEVQKPAAVEDVPLPEATKPAANEADVPVVPGQE